MPSHFPIWLHKKLYTGRKMSATEGVLNQYGLHTICESALCLLWGICEV
jgi:lipoate synthase